MAKKKQQEIDPLDAAFVAQMTPHMPLIDRLLDERHSINGLRGKELLDRVLLRMYRYLRTNEKVSGISSGGMAIGRDERGVYFEVLSSKLPALEYDSRTYILSG